MKTLILAALAALLATPALAADKTAATTSASKGNQALQSVLDQFDAAWGKGDAKAISTLYSEDATVLTADGSMLKGRAAIESAMAAMLGPAKGSQPHHTVASARWIGKDYAFADVDATFDNMPPAPKFHAVVLFHQQGGKWLMQDGRSYDMLDTSASAATPAPAPTGK